MIRVFFNKEIEQDPTFSKTSHGTTFRGCTVVKDGRGHWFFEMYAIFDDELPEGMDAFVATVTSFENFPLHPYREMGEYGGDEVHPDAEAVLDVLAQDHYHVRLRGKNVKSVMALYRDIRLGKVRPRESYESSQSNSSSCAETLDRLLAQRDDLLKKLGVFLQKQEALNRFSTKISAWRFPWLRKALVIKAFHEAAFSPIDLRAISREIVYARSSVVVAKDQSTACQPEGSETQEQHLEEREENS